MIDIAVLVSAGRHPVSARPRRADGDARALEVGLRLAEDNREARLQVLHAGDAGEPSLREYLGMGVAELTVLEVPADRDRLPALSECLAQRKPNLILTGAQAEAGLGSGCLPYALAAALDYALVSNIVAVEFNHFDIELRQALPRGRRRAWRARLPVLASVDAAAATPRQSAYARARRGILHRQSVDVELPMAPPLGDERPARQRPKRLRATSGQSAAQRLKAIDASSASGGRLIEYAEPEAAAREILDYLRQAGMVKPSST